MKIRSSLGERSLFHNHRPDGARRRHGWGGVVYVRTCSCPTLHPGDIVIVNKLRSHKVAGVRDAFEGAGATLRNLPPYHPDLNPIGELFSKLKTLLRKVAKRSVDALWNEIGPLFRGSEHGENDASGLFQ